jgi:predicted DNA-binding transcriptional regulator YafY
MGSSRRQRGRGGALAEHFEVSVRTIERDLSALGQAGIPLATKQGRTGGYTLDRSMSLPPSTSPTRGGGDRRHVESQRARALHA